MSAPRPRLLAVLGVVLMAAGLQLGAFALPSDAGPGDEPAAARAVRALVSGDVERARTAMPADFSSRMGYRPVRRDGLLVRPDGSCSSPLPLPARFETVCARHDLGYDLLRYAAARHRPLGQWARVRIDHALAAGLGDTCDVVDGAGCRLAARTAYLAVRANSRRQGDGVPGPESVASVGAVVLGGGGLLSLLVVPVPALTRRLSRLLRRSPTRAHTLRVPAAPVLLVGGLAVSASLVPSVLARPAWLQGLFTGLLVAATHPVGRLLARHTRGDSLDRSRARWASILVVATASVVSAAWPGLAGRTSCIRG